MIEHSAQYIDAMEALPMPFELSEVKDSRTENEILGVATSGEWWHMSMWNFQELRGC